MTRPIVEVADLLHKQGGRFMDQSPWLTFQQLSVQRAITRCRTAALGGHIDQCSQCGHEAISYNSCLMGSFLLWGVRRANQRCVKV
jgi:Transposase zinc-binding domain